MANFRIYPNKSNTIVEGTRLNTGKNGVMELWYGNAGRARFLIQFDFSDYNTLYSGGYVPHITATTATFNMKNCYPIFERVPYSTALPAEEADVEVKVVQQEWDEGSGHDFYGTASGNGISNWYSATSVQHWAAPGGDFAYTIFSGNVSLGYSDLSVTCTDEIELWNTMTGTNYGFCVKFADSYEDLTGSTKHILKYFTEEARTNWFHPYIELSWSGSSTATGTTTMSGSPNYFVTMTTLDDTYTNNLRLSLPVRFYQEFTSNLYVMDNVEYTIVLVDGTEEFTMVDWETLHWTATENYITLDTSWFLPNNEYRIRFRYNSNGYQDLINKEYKFRVIEGS